jgi:hypothetical protein
MIDLENAARICRVTCGWKLPHLSLDRVRPYWRDAHSPAIARRRGIYEYRHYPLDPVRADLFAPVKGIDFAAAPGQELMWLSDVRYADQAGLEAFGRSPDPHVRAQILADIEMIVDKSTTYLVLGDNGRTLVDRSGDTTPQGPTELPTFQVFLRQAGDQTAFRAGVKALAQRWSGSPGVVRLRLSVFETPDMEAERKAGYPVKTHPLAQQYQAWIDLVLEDEAHARDLLSPAHGVDYAAFIKDLHAYSTPAVYTFNAAGRPTFVGLRGYAAFEAVQSLGATHQQDQALLEWMYGDVARGPVSS